MAMYAVYGKDLSKPNSRYAPMDMGRVDFVVNKIFMTMYDERQKEDLERVVRNLNTDNPGFKFEIRRVD